MNITNLTLPANETVSSKSSNDLLKLDMKDLISKKFHFGASIDGILIPKTGTDATVFMVNSDKMNMIYRRKVDGYSGYVKQEIQLDWMFDQFCEKVPFFICPRCGKRAVRLYNKEIFFVCRKCYKLHYNIKIDDNKVQAWNMHTFAAV